MRKEYEGNRLWLVEEVSQDLLTEGQRKDRADYLEISAQLFEEYGDVVTASQEVMIDNEARNLVPGYDRAFRVQCYIERKLLYAGEDGASL